MAGSEAPRRTTLHLVTDQREPTFYFQVPAVRMHSSVLAAHGLPQHTLVRIRMRDDGRSTAAWLISDDEAGQWEACTTPWHRSAQLSLATWRRLTGSTSPVSGRSVEVTFPAHRTPIRPARLGHLLEANEIGMHRDDVRRLGLPEWVSVNHTGIPGLFRVRASSNASDLGIVRLSFHARMLLGVPPRRYGMHPELLLGSSGSDRLPPIDETPLEGRRSGRWRRPLRRPGALFERAATAVLRAPEISLRTAEAAQGEDQTLGVRLASGHFPVMGTVPGQQVYVAWGPRNRVVVTALAEEDDTSRGQTEVETVGGRADVTDLPGTAVLRIGAESRAVLGIPRTAVVTVQRRVGSLILNRLNELILPVTGLFLAAAANVRLFQWKIIVAAAVILILLLAPLRVRRNPRGRMP